MATSFFYGFLLVRSLSHCIAPVLVSLCLSDVLSCHMIDSGPVGSSAPAHASSQSQVFCFALIGVPPVLRLFGLCQEVVSISSSSVGSSGLHLYCLF